MEFVNLCKQYDKETVELYKEVQAVEIKRYLNFVLSVIKEQRIKDKITANFNEIVVYVLDKNSTEIPRILYGENHPTKIPRAAAFVREQIKNECDGVVYDMVKAGVALRIQEKNQGVIFHEINHAISIESKAVQEEGALHKHGMNISKLNLSSDKYERKTGNLIDESITDAIAYHYYNQNPERFTDENGDVIPYRTVYDGVRLFSTILLGKDLSNQTLLNAYFGDIEDLNLFIKEFDTVVNNPKVSFMDILKNDFNQQDALGDINFSDKQLVGLACTYRFNLCENLEQLNEEREFVKSLGVDMNDEQIKTVFENAASRIANRDLQS